MNPRTARPPDRERRSTGAPFVHRLLHLLRIVSQTLFFGLFVYLLLNTRFTGKDVHRPG